MWISKELLIFLQKISLSHNFRLFVQSHNHRIAWVALKKFFHMLVRKFLYSSFRLLLLVLPLHTEKFLASSICLPPPFRFLLILNSPLTSSQSKILAEFSWISISLFQLCFWKSFRINYWWFSVRQIKRK